jgi:hypothetical protein
MASSPWLGADSITGHANVVYCDTRQHSHTIRIGRPVPENLPRYVRDLVCAHGGAPSLNCTRICFGLMKQS